MGQSPNHTGSIPLAFDLQTGNKKAQHNVVLGDHS